MESPPYFLKEVIYIPLVTQKLVLGNAKDPGVAIPR
ncbi:MAG: hypothetical protein RL235_557, partial [Chlamydiota bacterium]